MFCSVWPVNSYLSGVICSVRDVTLQYLHSLKIDHSYVGDLITVILPTSLHSLDSVQNITLPVPSNLLLLITFWVNTLALKPWSKSVPDSKLSFFIFQVFQVMFRQEASAVLSSCDVILCDHK